MVRESPGRVQYTYRGTESKPDMVHYTDVMAVDRRTHRHIGPHTNKHTDWTLCTMHPTEAGGEA